MIFLAISMAYLDGDITAAAASGNLAPGHSK